MEQETSLAWIVGIIIVLFVAGFFLFGLWYLIPVMIGAGFEDYYKRKKKTKGLKALRIAVWVILILAILIAVYFDFITLI